MKKPVVFISHITEEKELAIYFKQLLEESFLGMIDVFVSSDENSISSGSKWLQDITKSLGECALELILCSPQSVQRPWINFEAGAGWIRNIPVIPLCHSGMLPNDLPIPINMLQATELNDLVSLNRVLPVIANALGSTVPKVDFNEFTEKVKKFETYYMFDSHVLSSVNLIKKIDENISSALMSGGEYINDYKESDLVTLQNVSKWLIENELLILEQLGSRTEYKREIINGVTKNYGGTYVKLKFEINPKIGEIIRKQGL